MKEVKFVYMDFINVDIKLRQRITVLNGNSSTGKSYLYNIIKEYVQEKKIKNILCLDVNNASGDNAQYTLNKLEKIKNGIIIMDYADNLLADNEIYDYVMSDMENYYMLLGRKCFEHYYELAKPKITKTSIGIQYRLNVI